jgi:hypothetical protein
MFKRPDPARLRQQRGSVLYVIYLAAVAEAANPDDPDRVGRNVLVMTLEQAGELPSNEELRNALRYLEGKGAVKVEWRHDGTGEFDAVRILTLGKDLAEGTVTDPGVQFARRRG